MCKYCTVSEDAYTEFMDTGKHVSIEPVNIGGGTYLHFQMYKRDIKVKINFCPICGKKLVDD